MGQCFITLKSAGVFGIKKIDAPEIYTKDSTHRYFKFPKSLFPNLTAYIITAQYRDTDNVIVPVHFSIVHKSESSWNLSLEINGDNHYSTTTHDSEYVYLGVKGDDSISKEYYDGMPTWVLEKGFMYEYK